MTRWLVLLAALLVVPSGAAAHGRHRNVESDRPLQIVQPAVQLVEWQGQFWDAQIVEKKGADRFLIHYVGWGPEWDETVGCERIRRVTSNGATVYVEWGQRYWAAEILRLEKDGSARIHYVGWGPEWDEVVPPSRILRATPTCG